jgi:hypothetical protein
MKYIIRPPLSIEQQEKRCELDDFGEKMRLMECKIGHNAKIPIRFVGRQFGWTWQWTQRRIPSHSKILTMLLICTFHFNTFIAKEFETLSL